MGLTPRGSLFFAPIQLAAIAIIVLSFMTWITTSVSANMANILGPEELRAAALYTFDYQGTDVYGVTGVDQSLTTGDGWLTAFLGLGIFLAAGFGQTSRSSLPNAVIAICGALGVAVLVYVRAMDWGRFAHGIDRDISYTWEFWATFALSLACGIAGFVTLFKNHDATTKTDTGEMAWA